MHRIPGIFKKGSAPVATVSTTPFDAQAFNGMQVNGGVDVSQELGTTGATLTNNTNKYIADCWEAMYNHGAATAVVTSAQLAAASFPTALTGFSFAHQVKATTAISSPANGDFARHRHQIEGYRVARLGFGAAGAQSVTVAFEFYSTVSGTAFLRLSNAAANRAYHTEFAVAAGWNFVTKTIAGDTSGTWEKATSTGLIVDVFSSGKTASPATPDAWGATPAIQTTNSTNLLGTNNNLTIVTGLVVLPGTDLPSQARLPLLMRVDDPLCYRYYEKSFNDATSPGTATHTGEILERVLAANSTAVLTFSFNFFVQKRVTATVTYYSPTSGASGKMDIIGTGGFVATVNSNPNGVSEKSHSISTDGATSGAGLAFHYVASARL